MAVAPSTLGTMLGSAPFRSGAGRAWQLYLPFLQQNTAGGRNYNERLNLHCSCQVGCAGVETNLLGGK